MGIKGLVWSASAMGILLNEGIGDTIRVSLTPRPGGDRREEVYAACEMLQALGLRSFSPSVTACPGLRPHHQQHVPGAGRADPGLHPRADARVEDALRRRRRRSRWRSWAASSTARASRRPPTSASACPAPAKRPTVPSSSTACTPRRCAAPTRSWRPASSTLDRRLRRHRGTRRAPDLFCAIEVTATLARPAAFAAREGSRWIDDSS